MARGAYLVRARVAKVARLDPKPLNFAHSHMRETRATVWWLGAPAGGGGQRTQCTGARSYQRPASPQVNANYSATNCAPSRASSFTFVATPPGPEKPVILPVAAMIR